MFDIFKKEIKVSDRVKLYLTIGKEIEGDVIEIGENHVLVKTIDSVQTRFFDKVIGGWDLIASIKQDEKTIPKVEEVIEQELVTFSPVQKQIGLKILGKIDLSKIEPKRKRGISTVPLAEDSKIYNPNDFELNGKFKSFEELKSILTETDNEKLVPANAVIIKHSESRGFGFLRIPSGSELFFGYRDIIDDDLVKKLVGERQNMNIQVTFSVTKNYRGEKATTIHLPWKVSQCHEIAKMKLGKMMVEDSTNLCLQILSAFPNNYFASELLKKVENQKAGHTRKTQSLEPVYLRGKKAKDKKNYDEAIELLRLSIRNNEKLDSAVKDLASCYQELGEIDKGIEIMEKYLDQLPGNSSTYNFVANFYSAAKNYSQAIKYLDELIELTPNYKQVDVLSRKVFCLVQLKRYDEALDIIDDILAIRHNHPSISNWQTKIKQAKKSGIYTDLDSLVEGISFTTFSGGIPPVLQYSLDRCDFTGLTAPVIAKQDFTEETLKSLRGRIERELKARPRERAKYLLTEAKLIQLLEADKEDLFRSVLSRYCYSLAYSLLVENYPLDVIRYYYLLSFELESNFDSISSQIVFYLMSNKFQGNTLISKGQVSFDKALIEIFALEKFDVSCLVEASFYNSTFANTVARRIYEHQKFQSKTVKYLKELGVINDSIPLTRDLFYGYWKKTIDKRKSEEGSQLAFIKSLINHSDLSVFYSHFLNLNTYLKKEWLTSLDIRRIDDFFKNAIYTINLYLTQINFDDKERQKGIILGQVTQLIEEIEEQPTRFSYDGLLPLLKHLEILINHSFKKLLESSTPKVSLSILGESRFIDDNNNVTVQLAVKNQSGCSPIQDIKVLLNEDINYRVTDSVLISSESLKGGEEKIISIPLNVSSTILKQEAATINVSLEYKSRERDQSNFLLNQPLALRFYSFEQFETIPNPYAAIADSGPVKDRNMFFGRENYIEEISNSLLSAPTHKFIDIYGQKRSGKSSLLYHLTQKLKESDKFICIDFTLGSTTKYDSASFFWLILDGIERYIEQSESDLTQRPLFEAPRLQELLLNPSIIFNEKIKDLYKELNRFDKWKDRKLLLLIDEFTYLYSATLRKNLDPEFMKTWKAMLERGLFSAIVIGQDIMPKFKAKFPNEFGVFEDRRLTYFKKEDAEKLIEKPIWDFKNHKSRFIGKAINKILDYTSLNPYYIQIFCARLVDFMNDHKLINVTEADVIDVAKSFVEGSQALPIDKFDNLLNAGDADLEAVPQEETLEILKQIANNSRVLGSCPRESISLKNTEYDDQILDDLLKRDVISCPNTNYYRIQVQIFNEWLLKH